MFNNNTSYQEAINAPSRRITGNVTIKGQKLSDDISSIDYVSSISGNTLTIGATNASTVDIKFKRLIEGLEEKELIRVSFSVQTSSGIVERQIGEFFLTEIKLDRNNKTTTLKAIDKMAFLNDKYTSTLLYPTLGRNIVQEIANSCNLRVNNNLNITSLPSFSKKLEKVTYREMLGYLAQTVGAFVIFNNNGELEFRKLNRTQKQISKGSYLLKGLEVDEVEYRINGISISLNNQEKTILAVGSPLGTQVKLTNPLMTQGWLNSIFSEYSRLRFNPFKLNWRGDPFVEVGDWVSIEIANGSYRAFPILELKLSYSGGLKSTIGANVKGTTTSTTEYKGTVERQIEFINARLGASGNYVYADTVEPTNPKDGDTWFKPNGAFTDLYIYENNQWVLKTSTGNIEGLITKITDSSVSTQNLATAIAKIIELDAARITTGSLSFEQLNSSAVSEIRKGMVSETKFNSFVNDSNGLRQQMSSEIERVVESKKSTLKGQDGKSSYIHKKYTNDVLAGPMTDNSNSLYIGIYTGDKAVAPTNMSEYEWTRVRGYNGVNSYIHRKYSDNSNGANMSDDSNLKYIGIYTGASATPPTTPTSYTWSKIKGEDGRQGVPGVRGADGRTSYLHTAYANSPTGDVDFSTTNSNGKEYIGTYSDFELADSNDYRRYKWVKIKGENGQNGRDGRDGQDGKSININWLPNSNFSSAFNKWEDVLTNSGLNSSFEHAKTNFGRGLHIWGTANADYKGLKSFQFKLEAKKGDKLTLSMDLGKDALTQNAPLKVGLQYFDKNSLVPPVKEEQIIDLATENFKIKKYKRISRTFTAKTDIDECIVMLHAPTRQLINFYIDNIKLEISEVATEWTPAYEDLQGHTLTANLWFSGNYINNVTKNVRLNLVLFYDGKEVNDFTTNVRYTSGVNSSWLTQDNLRTLRDGTIDYGFWGDGEKNGETLSAIATVNYKGLEIVSTARLDNVPNVEDVKETIKKFKTFESTLDSFKSVIGEIKGKEIKTIVKAPNLCTEDFSNNKTKSGNDLYFNVSPNLKANTKYTIILDVSFKKNDVHQRTKVYGAKSGGGEQWLKDGRNVWVVDYATEQNRVNIYPLGEFSQVNNVEIYEGDYREFIEQNNRFTSLGSATNQTSFYSYKINHNITGAKGKFFLVRFDLASLPSDKWFSSGDDGILALYSFGTKQFTEELKLKDNEYIFKALFNDNFYIFHNTNSLKITNVRLYEVRFGVTLATQNSLIDISSMIDQTKDSVTLSARKEIESKLTNYPTNAYLSNNYANKRDLESLVTKSELKVLSDRIESSVNTGNFGTTLSQNAYYVRVAWNGISNYVQFEDGGLNFYEGSNTQNNLRARIDDGNYTFWRDGYELGNMGTGYYKLDRNKKGIQFHLEYDGWFMGWAYKQKRTDNHYTWKWYYTSGSVGDTYADTLNAGCNTNFRWNEIWYFKTRTSWFNIMDGLDGTISVVSNIENTGDGGIRWWTRNLTFKNGILIGG
jgi:pblB-like tail protein|nr:MAG TPA: tail protein [Caudoviricetes sp.]